MREEIFICSAPNSLRSAPELPKIARYSATFANTSPYSNSLQTDFAADLATVIYPVGTGRSVIRSSIAPNRRRFRCPSASSSQ